MGGIILGAAIALAASLGTAALQAWLQARAMRGEYLWSKRAELYLDLLRRGSSSIAHLKDAEADEYHGWSPQAEELRQDLTARVDLFGSVKVETCWREVSRTLRSVDSYVTENSLLEMRGGYAQLRTGVDEDPGYVALVDDATKARNVLVGQLRRELDVDRHLKLRA